MGSEITAAVISDKIGQVRARSLRDAALHRLPCRRLLEHWLDRSAADADKLPKIFAINWFRRGEDGHFYGRVLAKTAVY